MALSSILKHKEAVQLLENSLPQVLETYIKLMELIDHEGIVTSLEEIVNKFSDKIGPYAEQLILNLANLF